MPPYPVSVYTFPVPSSASSPDPPSKSLQAYEHIFFSAFSAETKENALIFIGGLGDGPHGVPYPRALAASLASLDFSVFEVRLSSSFSAFGYSSLEQDAAEIKACVAYLRGKLGKNKVVLMGHSTGCQDCLEYVLRHQQDAGKGGDEREEGGRKVQVQGIILQGPVSDREAIKMSADAGELEGSLRVAEEMVREGKGEEVMPTDKLPEGWRGSPVTAYRWASLAGAGGDDDYFSSDLSDESLQKIWGRNSTPTLILPSEKDEWVSASIDVAGLIEKWKGFSRTPDLIEYGLIPGANHRVEDNLQAEKWLVERVAAFVGGLVSG